MYNCITLVPWDHNFDQQPSLSSCPHKISNRWNISKHPSTFTKSHHNFQNPQKSTNINQNQPKSSKINQIVQDQPNYDWFLKTRVSDYETTSAEAHIFLVHMKKSTHVSQHTRSEVPLCKSSYSYKYKSARVYKFMSTPEKEYTCPKAHLVISTPLSEST